MQNKGGKIASFLSQGTEHPVGNVYKGNGMKADEVVLDTDRRVANFKEELLQIKRKKS